MSMTDLFIGRQPIFDRHLQVIGYELLYRSGQKSAADFLDGDHATASVLSNTFMSFGLDNLVEDKLAFINLTAPFLTGQYPLPGHHDRLVLEILEDTLLDAAMIECIRQLSAQGYVMALDDVVDHRAVEAILDRVDLVKVDFMQVNKAHLPEQVAYYKSRGVELLAEKIETQAELSYCQELGFDYFQGYFLSKPVVIQHKKISTSRMIILQLLNKLEEKDVAFQDIEVIITQDVGLSFKLLRLINSAYFGTRSEIASIHQALSLLGLEQIRNWISLLLLSESDQKPAELIRAAMIRARMSELLATLLKLDKPQTAFTVGLFSVLDALLDMSPEDIFSQIPLTQKVKQALVSQEGILGDILSAVIAYEAGHWDLVTCASLNTEHFQKSYLEAVQWSQGLSKSLSAA